MGISFVVLLQITEGFFAGDSFALLLLAATSAAQKPALLENKPFLVVILITFAVAIVVLLLLYLLKGGAIKKLRLAYFNEKQKNKVETLALAEAEKASAAKGAFMSRISHEIRTPLNAIIGYNTIAKDVITAANSDEERRQAEMKVMDCLTKSEMASKHLLTIINDVLDMSAIESGKLLVENERFDFKVLINSLTSIFYTQARSKGVDFEVVFDTFTEEWFVGDQMKVNQILTNLLSNAIKFTEVGGRVKLTVCQPEAKTNAAHIHFEVADTGIGMKQEYLSHIWAPFEQADSSIARRYGGTGLGLTITKSLVDLMGGTISVESIEGVGSTFKVDLTLKRTEQPKTVNTYDFSNVRALVVDDDESTCDYVRLLFTRCGARCKTVMSGMDAVNEFKTSLIDGNDRFTLCIIDWRMPQMDGIETVKQIRSIAGDKVPIIILTAYDFSEIVAAKGMGVNMFISKPLFQSSLFDLLANICGRQTSDDMARSTDYDFAGAKVLLAEDNAMNMEVAKHVLLTANITFDSALNGREALETFERSQPGTYKAILMDVHMPEMDGHEATRRIRASAHLEAKTIPIIAMTADAFSENIQEAIEAGMTDHISKPIDTAVLFEILSKYVVNRN